MNVAALHGHRHVVKLAEALVYVRRRQGGLVFRP